MTTRKTEESELDRILREAGLLDDQVEEEGAAKAEAESQSAAMLEPAIKEVVGKGTAEQKHEALMTLVARLFFKVRDMERGWKRASQRIEELEEAVKQLKDKVKGS
jgi:hypothetical protein